jgi:hypothetical protein
MAVGVHIGVTVDVSEGDEADGLSEFGLYLYAVDGKLACGFHRGRAGTTVKWRPAFSVPHWSCPLKD